MKKGAGEGKEKRRGGGQGAKLRLNEHRQAGTPPALRWCCRVFDMTADLLFLSRRPAWAAVYPRTCNCFSFASIPARLFGVLVFAVSL